LSARARFLLARLTGIFFGVPIIFVIVTFGIDSILKRHDPATDLNSMRYVMVAIIVLLSVWQCLYELKGVGEGEQGDCGCGGRRHEKEEKNEGLHKLKLLTEGDIGHCLKAMQKYAEELGL
jgi:hypothetical protein